MSYLAAGIFGGAVVGAYASNSAANTQANAANNATAVQQAMYNQTASNVAPWLSAGQSSLGTLMGYMGLGYTGQGGGSGGQTLTGSMPSGVNAPDSPNLSGVAAAVNMSPQPGSNYATVGGSQGGMNGAFTPSGYQTNFNPQGINANFNTSGVQTNMGQVNPYQNFSMQQFQQDPGYQFQLSQMQNQMQNASSLTGGANSNNMKGLMGATQGLANQDYQQALNNYMSQYQLGNQTTLQNANLMAMGNQAIGQQWQGQQAGNAAIGQQAQLEQMGNQGIQLNNQNLQQQFANLEAMSNTGISAGLQQGQISQGVGASIGNNIIGAGNASAAGQVGIANAVTGSASSGYNSYIQSQYLNALTGNNGVSAATPYNTVDMTGFQTPQTPLTYPIS